MLVKLIFSTVLSLSGLFFSSLYAEESLDFLKVLEDAQKQYSPIAYAVSLNNEEVVKFLLEMNEDPNRPISSEKVFQAVINSIGRSAWREDPVRHQGPLPLEIAVNNENFNLIKILLEYLPERRADAEMERTYHLNISGSWSGGLTRQFDERQVATMNGLTEAIKKQKEPALVDLLLQHYQTNEKLYAQKEEIRKSLNPEYMQSYIKRLYCLVHDTNLEEISLDVTQIFMNYTLEDLYEKKIKIPCPGKTAD